LHNYVYSLLAAMDKLGWNHLRHDGTKLLTPI
jgi:hypothetical protein